MKVQFGNLCRIFKRAVEFCRNNFLSISKHLLLVPARTIGPRSPKDQRNEKHFTKSAGRGGVFQYLQKCRARIRMGSSRDFFLLHMNLFCRFGMNFSITSSFYSWGSELCKSEATCPRSFRKTTADPRLEFTSLRSQCNI